MTKFIPIWTEEAKAIVRDNWGRMGADVIRAMIIQYCKDRAAYENRDSVMIPSVGGVLWQAHKMGLIDDLERDELIAAFKRKPLSPKLKRQIFERDGYRCLICGREHGLEVDHIIPVAMGGKDNESNLQTLCQECHRVKGLNSTDARKFRDAVLSKKRVFP